MTLASGTNETAQERYEREIMECSPLSAVSHIIEDDDPFFDDGADYDPFADRRPEFVKEATRGWRVLGGIET